MPVVMPLAASTDTVKSVLCISRLWATMRCNPNWRARSSVIGAQISPRPCFAMKLTRGVRDFRSRHDEIALVFTVGVISDDDDAPLSDVCDGLGDGIKMHTH